MPNYFDQFCPVCKKQFEQGDDIVTCPECGTPHHRECYNMIGKCVNHGLHQSGFEYNKAGSTVVEKAVANDDEEAEEIIPELVPPKKDDTAQERTTPFGASPFSPIQLESQEYENSGKIDDIDISDIAATVRTNPARFIAVFKKLSQSNSKISWNWGAFFFGSFYLLFRKMYKQGVAFFCLALTTLIGSEALLLKFAPEAMTKMQELVQVAIETKAKTIDYSAVFSTGDYKNVSTIMYAALGIIIVLRLIEALLADYMYKKTVFGIIRAVSEKLSNGSTFTQSTMIFGQTQEIPQKALRKMYLGNKGGVSLFAPFVAYFVIYIIINFV